METLPYFTACCVPMTVIVISATVTSVSHLQTNIELNELLVINQAT